MKSLKVLDIKNYQNSLRVSQSTLVVLSQYFFLHVNLTHCLSPSPTLSYLSKCFSLLYVLFFLSLCLSFTLPLSLSGCVRVHFLLSLSICLLSHFFVYLSRSLSFSFTHLFLSFNVMDTSLYLIFPTLFIPSLHSCELLPAKFLAV